MSNNSLAYKRSSREAIAKQLKVWQSMNAEMQCTKDTIHDGDVMVFGNGREVSMLKILGVQEQCRDQQLLAACIVHGNVIFPLSVSTSNG